jgi:hypothetical protein
MISRTSPVGLPVGPAFCKHGGAREQPRPWTKKRTISPVVLVTRKWVRYIDPAFWPIFN